ncbi:hypothetical protein CYFUS_006727 [Cystobacter fuscus]|uniref:Uncharacterized protein n=1 Tax=Cystobacter fuscus TaxID=43 RepID=A0A250JCR1_9BACT|nr:hypothetical protein [Cystobacter fuscus]ATB41262.1 hypothetical protein CYFUS_006727 [Cystobacter fuscus]
MDARESLAHILKIKFRLPPARPSDEELDAILGDVAELRRSKRRDLTEEEWGEIVYRHVKFRGKYLYEGLDFSDLNALYAMLRAQAQSMRK